MTSEPVFSLADVAFELSASVEDVVTVASVELDPDEFDDESDTVTASGRARIVAHFHGGSDPDS